MQRDSWLCWSRRGASLLSPIGGACFGTYKHTHTHSLSLCVCHHPFIHSFISLSVCVCASLCVSCGTTARPSARQPLICTCPTRFEVRFGCLVGGPGVWAFTLHLWMPPFSFNGVSSTHMDARYGHHRIPACCFKRPSVRIRGV